MVSVSKRHRGCVAENGVGPRGVRSQASWLTPLLVAAQLAGVAHMALVQHSACPEHGQLVHAEGLDAHHALEHADVELREAQIAAGKALHEESDEHCAVVGDRRERAVPALFAAHGIQDALPVGATLVARATPLIAGAARYLLAPKTSPPA